MQIRLFIWNWSWGTDHQPASTPGMHTRLALPDPPFFSPLFSFSCRESTALHLNAPLTSFPASHTHLFQALWNFKFPKLAHQDKESYETESMRKNLSEVDTYNVKNVEEKDTEGINCIKHPGRCTKGSFWIQNIPHIFPKSWSKNTAKEHVSRQSKN